MTEKLKVSREVADVIDSLNRKDLSTDTWIRMHSEGEWVSVKNKPLNTLSLEEFARALIVGYEVEMTPAEIINSKYQKAADERKESEDDYRIQYLGGYQYGVQETLRVLEIIVEGVNDDAN